jgi:hypothetical protein
MRLAYQIENHPVHFIIAAPGFEGTASELWESVVRNQPELASLNYIEVDVEDYPLMNTDRENSLRQKPYRNAWKIEGGKVVPDLEAAREIHLANIRRIRAAKLDALDKEFIEAERNRYDTTELEQRRRELLDVTEAAKAAAIDSQESLYALWPAVLEARK